MTVIFRGGNGHVRALAGRLRRIRAGRVADALLIGFPAALKARRAGDGSLRAVASIRLELDAINLKEASTGVSETGGGEEVARLARAVNRTLERLREAGDRAERARERQRQFAADASHELCTPIAALRMRLEEAQLHPDEIDLDDLLGHTLHDLDRVQAIVTDLLLLTRLGTVPRRVERVNLTALVRAEAARQVDGPHMHLRLDPGVIVDGDREQISRMLGNLLDNARRHAVRAIRIGLRRAGDGAELMVADDGEGIPLADRERIFHRFVRLDAARSRDRGGAGLGLAVARAIASAHHGSLHVEECAWGGACFVLRMPLSPGCGPEA
ncbi:cell wall metabolism sensor histidine kinase WalK [Microbispora sp. H10836]|uniref:sensor histidine kinase n=1 Tax=Microbispora sp. H10836 TaxID=2729106 RepID=UPI0014764C38|nr:HAMP domain-containing sensor histidine kinase [Microbispora sp. H10836]